MSEALGKHQCAACGTVRKTSNLRYDPTTFLPYCQHAEICSPGHPNSPTSILERGQGLNLVTLNEAEKLYREKLLIEHPDAEAVVEIRKLLEKPTSLRVQSPDLAKYLVQVKKEYQMDTMAETVRYLLTLAMESHGEFYADRRKLDEDTKRQQSIEHTIRAVESGTSAQIVGDPQSVHHSQNGVQETAGKSVGTDQSGTHVENVRKDFHADHAPDSDTTDTDTNVGDGGITRDTRAASDDGGWDF